MLRGAGCSRATGQARAAASAWQEPADLEVSCATEKRTAKVNVEKASKVAIQSVNFQLSVR